MSPISTGQAYKFHRSIFLWAQATFRPSTNLPALEENYFLQSMMEAGLAGNFTPPTFYVAGDFRANEQPTLMCMYTLFVREHNRQVRRGRTIDRFVQFDRTR